MNSDVRSLLSTKLLSGLVILIVACAAFLSACGSGYGASSSTPTSPTPVPTPAPSAEDNPQAPLSHHHMDSTHITPGVVRGGLQAGPWRAEASIFHGREPDQDRFDIDLGRLDSGAERRVAWLAGLGQNREIHGNLEAYLFEATIRPSPMNSFYTRIESVAKDILDTGFHPRGTFHRHRQSQVGAFTLGYVRDVLHMSAGTFGAGADITGYAVPANLKDSYGSPLSFHVFVRYRAPIASSASGAPVHVH